MTTLIQQLGRRMGAALVQTQETEYRWMLGNFQCGEGHTCCGHAYIRFGWFRRHRNAKHTSDSL